MKRFTIVIAAVLFTAPSLSAQVTGLSGWSLYIDPGHSRTENMGLYNYSEAEKVLRVSLALRDMLLETTDIEAIYMARTNDDQLVTLTQRTDHANQTGADFYYSVHSDAGSPGANSTLMLYGGWRQNGQTVEKTPAGGRHFGDIMDDVLTRSMRIGRRGNYADRTFYQGFPFEHTNRFPYLHVNRTTNMASLLSEAGFHTNPTQQQRNLNAEWKVLEAKAAYWTILRFHGVERPSEVILTGFVSNIETGRLINGAEITAGDRTYVTDTFESLFHRYSNNPDELANGFYYIDELPDGQLNVRVEAEGFYPHEAQVATIDTFFTFYDVSLLSSTPPFVLETTPAAGTEHPAGETIFIRFSRPMDRETTLEAFSIEPEVTGAFAWREDDTLLRFRPDSLAFLSEYTITIAETAEDKHGHLLDGNADGTAGDPFVLTFTTGPQDEEPPVIFSTYPADAAENVHVGAVITFEFDEEIDPESMAEEQIVVTETGNGAVVDGLIEHFVVEARSVLNFFPSETLIENTSYTAVLAPGIADVFGNEMETGGQVTFTTTPELFDYINLDNFEPESNGNWWAPQQSGSTSGIITEVTHRNFVTDVVNHATGSTRSMQLEYGFNPDAASRLIRLYLGGGAPRSVNFNDQQLMQAYVFGDGTGNRMRFAARDAQNQIEANRWITIDWIGWRLVTWDMRDPDQIDPSGLTGDGSLDGNAIYDSFQMTWTAGRPNIGAVYFDDLRILQPTGVVSAEDDLAVPAEFLLHPNYPNPFNPATNIRFELPETSPVTVRVFNTLGAEVARLANGSVHAPGTYTVRWDAADLPSGVYFIQLEAGSFTQQIKAVLIK